MAITSREIPAPRDIRSAIISRSALARRQPVVQRGLAMGLWAISLAGALLWAGGGVAAWLTLSPRWVAVGAALAAQIICSAVQWIFSHDRWNPYYLTALLVSSGTTTLGYWDLIYAPLAGMLQSWDGALWQHGGAYIAAMVIFGIALAVDIYPERVLTE